MLNKQQIKILEIVQNKYITETYYDKDGGTKSKGGSYAYAENDGGPIKEIVDAVLKNEIPYKNFFEHIKNNFEQYGPKKMEIIEAILHILDDDELQTIKDLTV